MSKIKFNGKSWAWYAYDIGNSAHALLISTIGFSLYFKDYLYQSKPEGNSLWATITALILLISAIISPLLSSYVINKNKRALGLLLPTLICVIATIALGTDISNEKLGAIILYFVSSLGYYLALPIYNSYLPDVSSSSAQKTSAKGWALGYLGGILAASICFGLKLLDNPVTEDPNSYRLIFLVAGFFNLALSLPLLFVSFKIDKNRMLERRAWSMKNVTRIFREDKSILRLLCVYWLIGEIAVIITYFFAIFLREYALLETKQILIYSLVGQFVAILATWYSGFLSDKFGGKKIIILITFIWIIIPILLFLISKGITFWISIVAISLVIGAYNSVIRGKISEISNSIINPEDKGSLFGFLEVAGRFSQVIGPLLIALVTLYFPLNYGILFVMIFPISALILLRNYKWQQKSAS